MDISIELLMQVDTIIQDGLFLKGETPTHLERGIEIDEAKVLLDFHDIVMNQN